MPLHVTARVTGLLLHMLDGVEPNNALVRVCWICRCSSSYSAEAPLLDPCSDQVRHHDYCPHHHKQRQSHSQLERSPSHPLAGRSRAGRFRQCPQPWTNFPRQLPGLRQFPCWPIIRKDEVDLPYSIQAATFEGIPAEPAQYRHLQGSHAGDSGTKSGA